MKLPTGLFSAFLIAGLMDAGETAAQTLVAKYPELLKPVTGGKAATTDGNTINIYAVCSRTKPRTGEAVLEWPTPLPSFSNLRVDVTFYVTGFENSKFATLYPIDESKSMRVIDPEMLVKAEVEENLELRVLSIDHGGGEKNAMIRLEGLGSGINYSWRVLQQRKDDWLSGEWIEVYGPTCPADFIDKH